MGYRSQVCIAISKDLFNEKANASLKKYLEDCDKVLLNESKDSYYFLYDYVKWYDGFKEVDCINDFIRENADRACLLRIGEEDNDIERIGDTCNFNLYITRDFDIPKHTIISNEAFFASNSIKFIKDHKE